MDLELTDEQRWLAESVTQLLADTDQDGAWPALTEFGALQIASGADGLGAVELALVGRALGESLSAVPFIDTAAARYATRPSGTPQPLAFAELHGRADTVSLCLLEPGAGWELPRPATATTARTASAAAIDGHKVAVQHAASARTLLLLYSEGDERRLALLDRAAPGITVTPTSSIDPSIPTASVALAGVDVADHAALPGQQSEAVLARLLAIGAVLAASEAVGAAARVVELARDHAAERRQFGRTIGSFQALRHLLADMYVKQASSWSTVLFAAAALEDGIDGAERTASIAKAYASRVTLEVAHGALQVFGGIGFTAEHAAHRFLRRILIRGGAFGDAVHHERAIGRELTTDTRSQELVA